MRCAALLLLLSCGAATMKPPDEGPATACNGAVTLATMDEADGGFLPLHDGDDVTVHAGPQGGFHIYVGAEVAASRTGLLRWRLVADGGVELASRSLDVSTVLIDEAPCGWRRTRDALVFLRNEDVDAVRGVPVLLEATVDVVGVTKVVRVVPR